MGIAGLQGHDKTELIAWLVFYLRTQGIFIKSKPVSRNPIDAIQAGIAFVPEDENPRTLLNLTVRENIALKSLYLKNLNFILLGKKGSLLTGLLKNCQDP